MKLRKLIINVFALQVDIASHNCYHTYMVGLHSISWVSQLCPQVELLLVIKFTRFACNLHFYELYTNPDHWTFKWEHKLLFGKEWPLKAKYFPLHSFNSLSRKFIYLFFTQSQSHSFCLSLLSLTLVLTLSPTRSL